MKLSRINDGESGSRIDVFIPRYLLTCSNMALQVNLIGVCFVRNYWTQ